ncbi:MAG: hypothetical protein PHU64_07420 [Candidatus Omnitrophica bacterium]|nr:hypothetical protein [Candidatus Omnitrophota bacterium]
MNRKAVALILSCVVSVVLAILGLAILSGSIAENNMSQRNLQFTQAFWLAEAGLQKALYSLNEDNWQGWQDTSGDKSLEQALGSGTYNVEISNISGGQPQIIAIGLVGQIQRVVEASLTEVSPLVFTHAAFGKTSLTMTGNSATDSYDSSLGAYGISNRTLNGDVGTNGSSVGAVSLAGNASVGGDVQTGAGGTVEVSGNAAISGDVSDESEKEIPSVEIPSSLSSLVSLGSYSVSANSTETLISGDYKFSSFTVSGNGRVVLEGSVNLYLTSTSEALKISGNGNVVVSPGADVKIYTEGKVLISGNGISNSTNLPEKLILYSTYSDTGEGVKISGNGDFFGAVYAPSASIKVSGNGDVFGAILGDEALVTGNGNVHYDEALGRLNTGSCRYSVEEWKESEGTYVIE